MTIGVDAGMLGVSDERLKVGVYHVANNLLKNIAALDKKNTYRLYSFLPIPKFGNNMHNIVLSPARGYLRLRLPLELRTHPVDIFLGLGQALPPFFHTTSIGFVYDLGFLFHKEAYGNSYKKLLGQTNYLVKHASHIITISNATKHDIVSLYDRDPKTITVCYPGVDDRFKPQGERYHHKNPYILFVGSLTKTKDIPLLLQSLALVKKPLDLLLAGGDYWPDPAIDESINRYKLSNRVKKLGFVSDEMLSRYYRGAVAFVTTALHEGFCLPAVEAMACGTPVVAVNRGALAEIVGDGGIIVRPDAQSIANAVVSMNKHILGQNAIERAKVFSWHTFAKKVLSLYET